MRKIKLTQGKYALVDDKDYEWLNQWKWYLWKPNRICVGYAVRNDYRKGHRTIRMHILILGKKNGYEVDHINGNGIDNRRKNLRFLTRSQNCSNILKKKNKRSCGYVGVYWCPQKSKINPWVSRLRVDGREIYIGNFKSSLAAHRARRKACKELRQGISLGRKRST